MVIIVKWEINERVRVHVLRVWQKRLGKPEPLGKSSCYRLWIGFGFLRIGLRVENNKFKALEGFPIIRHKQQVFQTRFSEQCCTQWTLSRRV
jgi:hypothetical protein